MTRNEPSYQKFVRILHEELIPAGGCTEPIAIAYAAATARKVLDCEPEHMTVHASGNLIKNAKGVFIPGGGDLRGVDAAAVLGMLGGDADKKLEVLLHLPSGMVEKTKALLDADFCQVQVLQTKKPLHLVIQLDGGGHTVLVELKNSHTNIIRVEKDGEILRHAEPTASADGLTDHACLSVASILDFARTCELPDVQAPVRNQMRCNRAIADEGLTGKWGVAVGKTYLEQGKPLHAYAAAASDARMSGCDMPVVIVSGSGNQGATASLPVMAFAEQHNCPEEQLLRALVLSDLLAVHLKTGIGRLSAYCGAVCAATASGCAMTFLAGGSDEQIAMALTNTLATASGIFCDGAKPSCAAKIAAGIECAVLGHELAMAGRTFLPGEGIVMDTVEDTIAAVGKVASQGMNICDQVILDLMTK